MTLALPIVWIPVLVIVALISPILVILFSRGWVSRWQRIVIYILLGLVGVPSLLLGLLTLPYLDGPYTEMAWTYMAALLMSGIGVSFAVRASIRAGRKQRDA